MQEEYGQGSALQDAAAEYLANLPQVSSRELAQARKRVTDLEDKLAALYEKEATASPAAFKKATQAVANELQAAEEVARRFGDYLFGGDLAHALEVLGMEFRLIDAERFEVTVQLSGPEAHIRGTTPIGRA